MCHVNLVLNRAATAWIPENFLSPIMTHYQIPLWPLLTLIKTHYQILPALPVQLALMIDDPDRSGKCALQESPKNQVRQKRRLPMIDEDKHGVRIKVIPSFKQKFRRQMQQANQLQDDFFLPNRAQLVLNFLKKHGDHLVKEKPGPKKRFASTIHLVQHVLKQK